MSAEIAIATKLPKCLVDIIVELTKPCICICGHESLFGDCPFLASGAHTETSSHCTGCGTDDDLHHCFCSVHPKKCKECRYHTGHHEWDCPLNPLFGARIVRVARGQSEGESGKRPE